LFALRLLLLLLLLKGMLGSLLAFLWGLQEGGANVCA
jgi:hypothetical protein